MRGSITKGLFIQPRLGPEGEWLVEQIFGKRKEGWRDKLMVFSNKRTGKGQYLSYMNYDEGDFNGSNDFGASGYCTEIEVH